MSFRCPVTTRHRSSIPWLEEVNEATSAGGLGLTPCQFIRLDCGQINTRPFGLRLESDRSHPSEGFRLDSGQPRIFRITSSRFRIVHCKRMRSCLCRAEFHGERQRRIGRIDGIKEVTKKVISMIKQHRVRSKLCSVNIICKILQD